MAASESVQRMEGNRITLKQIAGRAGVHATTVSMALRNHPRIPESTRKRLKELADKMGYVPDPVLASLNAYRHRMLRGKTVGTLGWLNIFDSPFWPDQKYINEYVEGAAKRANQLGYHIDKLNISKANTSPARLQNILLTRGIEGLIIAPLEHPIRDRDIPDQLNWNHFCGITIGYSLRSPALHRVALDYHGSLTHVIRELHKLGYTRPGLCLESGRNARLDRLWETGYYVGMRKAFNFAGLPVGLFEASTDQSEKFLHWYDTHQPDVIIAQAELSPMALLKSRGVKIPEDCGIVHLDDYDPPVSSLHQQNRVIGETAVNLLVGAIRRHELGLPHAPLITLVQGQLQINPATLECRDARLPACSELIQVG